ncbi:L-arabinose 1-dehydrogenase (NAD(P)(+)) [uncultured archaeon]|nr:L-arabinose 1-dehydrogenase (NAD(P)(+)) [uncultured archaeon]
MQAKKEDNKSKRVVFVTGASGGLGTELVKALLAEGDEVRCLIHTKETLVHMPVGIIPFVGNLNDERVLVEACDGADTVFHLAAIVREARVRTDELMHVNLEGTKNLLAACKRSKVRHIIFTSTIDVYGRKRKDMIKESSKLTPTDKYGYSKMLAEREVISSGVPYTILRISTIYGPAFRKSFFKVFKALRANSMIVIGSGQNHLALVSSDDVVEAMVLAENNKASLDKVYNLSDGVTYTQEFLMQLAAKSLDAPKPTRYVNELLVRMLARQRNLESDELRFLTSNRMIDISAIKAGIGFAPKVTVEKGVKELAMMFLEKCKERKAGLLK